jgi:hypothetical protein
MRIPNYPSRPANQDRLSRDGTVVNLQRAAHLGAVSPSKTNDSVELTNVEQ